LELTREIKALSRREGVTLFMTLLASFKVLLSRYSGQKDIIVGALIGNRDSIGLERLIGYFINTLPLRTDLSGDPSFRELLARVREVALDAYAHQELPFEKLVDELQPERRINKTPLFRTTFELRNTSKPSAQIPGLTITPVGIQSELVQFDLSLSMAETEHGLIGALEYDADLFDAPEMKQMVVHLKNLLESIVGDPDQRLSNLRLLSGAESQGHRPVDFPYLQLSQKDLEDILMEINSTPNVETAPE
jgi:non-ribosomal peptide synthetase component F